MTFMFSHSLQQPGPRQAKVKSPELYLDLASGGQVTKHLGCHPLSLQVC